MRKKNLLFMFIVLVMVCVSCSSTPTAAPPVACETEAVNSYLDNLTVQLEAFDSAFKGEGPTSRAEVDSMIQEMQAVQETTSQLDAPECAAYLQEYVLVSMQTELDSFISFYSEESDVIVSRKMETSASVREFVNQEFLAFKANPIKAYTASEIEPQQELDKDAAAQPFKLPANWEDIRFEDKQTYQFSIPDTWNFSTFGENNGYVELVNQNETMFILLDTLDESFLGDYTSDSVRLFGTRTKIEMGDWEYYAADSTEIGLYAKNKTYEFIFSKREYLDTENTKSIWAIVVTPDDEEVFMVINTKQADFSPTDLETLRTIYSSIRPVN